MKYRKNDKVKTEAQALDLLKKYADFINPDVDSSGEPQPTLDAELLAIHNSGETLEWDEETQSEYDQRIAQEESDAEQQTLEAIAEKRKSEIQDELTAIDLKSIRALRENDTARITQFEDDAELLRMELADLTA